MSEPFDRASRTTRMQREIAEAPAAIRTQLDANAAILDALGESLRRTPPRIVATAARGSSDNAATYARYLIETQAGTVTSSAAPSVQSVYAAAPDLAGALLLAISQSGKSPDLLAQAAAAKRAGARVAAMVNVEDSPLAAEADVVIPLRAGPEHSVAATKSFLCSLSAIAALVAAWTRDDALAAALREIPSALERAAGTDWRALVDGLADARNLFVVGRGPGLAAAQEAALKLKETCGLHAEAFSAAEVQHGPMTLIGDGFPVLVFVQDDDTREGTLAAAARFRDRGARVWIAGAGDDVPGALPLPCAPHAALAPIVAVHRFYAAANALALRLGRDPDAPPHLRKVTETV